MFNNNQFDVYSCQAQLQCAVKIEYENCKKTIHWKHLKSSISYTTIYSNIVYNNKNMNVRKKLMLLVNSYIDKGMPR